MPSRYVRAQFASLQGRVEHAVNRIPLEGANVVLHREDGDRIGTVTNTNGSFNIQGIPPGRHVVRVSFVGYTSFQDTLAFNFGQQHVITIPLEPTETEVGEVVVQSEKETLTEYERAGLVSISPAALRRIPMPDVGSDLAAYLVTLPGVITTGDRGGQLFIRGGTPAQNMVLIDGMPVYQPFHIVGFYSSFPSDIIAQADVYAGGFGAKYGGRLSSVIDVSTRNGNKERISGAVSLAPFLSSLRLEVPVVPGKVSVLANARESVIEKIGPEVLKREFPFRFGDRFVKLHAFLNQTSSFSATMLRTFDEGQIDERQTEPNGISWKNEVYGARYTYLPSESPVLTRLSVFSSRLESRYQSSPQTERNALIEGIEADINFIYLLGDHQIDFGLSARSNTFRYDLGGQSNQAEDYVSEGGGYLDILLQPHRTFQMEPGVRLYAFSSGLDPVVEPRLRISWKPGRPAGRNQINVAWGMYHQQIVGLNNLQDVTDVFTAWTPVPSNEPVPRSRHLLAGIQRQIKPWIRVIVEGFDKTYAHSVFARYTEADIPVIIDRVDGYARGFDVRLEITRRPVFFYAGYGFATVVYESNLDDFPVNRFHPPHDRRHQINVVGHLEIGTFDVSMRWQIGSGRPFTQVYGFYEAIDTERPSLSFHTAPGTTTLSFARPYAARLPYYHRLDVALERSIVKGQTKIVFHAGAINVYDRANLFDYDLHTLRRVNQLPFIPSAGIRVEVN